MSGDPRDCLLGPPIGQSCIYTYTDDSTGGPWHGVQLPYHHEETFTDLVQYYKIFCGTQPTVTPKEGVEMQGLFEFYLVYGESRKEPVVHSARVVATSDEEAKLKSGLYPLIQKDWDPDFVTLFVRKLGDVAVKERAKETVIVK